MNLTHLGDALDHWKGSLIELIRGENLRVVPMFTDTWNAQQIEAYARLLHVRPEDILKRDSCFSSKTRKGYCCDLGEYDLFLDPDTGIAAGNKGNEKHVRSSEIADLLSVAPSRLLLVYQHASRKKGGIREKINLLRSAEGLEGCDIFAYDCGGVSMTIISGDHERAQEARRRLKNLLGEFASARIVEAVA